MNHENDCRRESSCRKFSRRNAVTLHRRGDRGRVGLSGAAKNLSDQGDGFPGEKSALRRPAGRNHRRRIGSRGLRERLGSRPPGSVEAESRRAGADRAADQHASERRAGRGRRVSPLGAVVSVGEAPGHVRDTEMALVESGMGEASARREAAVRRSQLQRVPRWPNKGGWSALASFTFPTAVLARRPDCFDAQAEDPPLGRRHRSDEKSLWHVARGDLRLAEERAALRRHPADGRGHQRLAAAQNRHRRRHPLHGRRRAAVWARPSRWACWPSA